MPKSKKTDDKTYALGSLQGGFVIMEMADNGTEFTTAGGHAARLAMRLGVHCLNSGLTESEIVELLHARTGGAV